MPGYEQPGTPWVVASKLEGRPVASSGELYPCRCEDLDRDPPAWKRERALRSGAKVVHVCDTYFHKTTSTWRNRCPCWGRERDERLPGGCCSNHRMSPRYVVIIDGVAINPASVTVELTADQMDEVLTGSMQRTGQAIEQNRNHRWSQLHRTEDHRWRKDFQGCKCERALAAYLGVRWEPKNGKNYGKIYPKVDPFDINSTTLASGQLMVRPDDPLNRPMMFATTDSVEDPKVTLHGWIYAREARDLGVWENRPQRGSGDAQGARWAWWVDRFRLRPVTQQPGTSMSDMLVDPTTEPEARPMLDVELPDLGEEYSEELGEPLFARRPYVPRWTAAERNCACPTPWDGEKVKIGFHCSGDGCHQNFMSWSASIAHSKWVMDPCKDPATVLNIDGIPVYRQTAIGAHLVWAWT